MQHGQLMSHVDTDLVTREQLALIPAPQATAIWRSIPSRNAGAGAPGKSNLDLRGAVCAPA